MSAWEVIKICAQYIWLHNVPEWIAWLKEMAPAFALFGVISAGVIAEVIETEAEAI